MNREIVHKFYLTWRKQPHTIVTYRYPSGEYTWDLLDPYGSPVRPVERIPKRICVQAESIRGGFAFAASYTG